METSKFTPFCPVDMIKLLYEDFDGCATVQDTNMLCAVKLLQMLFTG